MFARAWFFLDQWRGKWELLFNGYRVSAMQDGKVLEIFITLCLQYQHFTTFNLLSVYLILSVFYYYKNFDRTNIKRSWFFLSTLSTSFSHSSLKLRTLFLGGTCSVFSCKYKWIWVHSLNLFSLFFLHKVLHTIYMPLFFWKPNRG